MLGLTYPSQRSFSPEQLDQRLRAGLVGHWIGGGSGNTWFDRSGYGNHGTLTNGPVWTLGVGGKRNAIQFDGVNDYVLGSVSDQVLLITSTVTACCWVRPLAATGTYELLAAKRNSNGSSTAFQIFLNTGNRRFGYYNGTNAAVGTFAPPTGEWTHLLATVTGTALTLYANGTLTDSITVSGGVGNGGSGFPLQIGANQQSSGEYYSGLIDDVRVYNRALSSAEIALLASPSFSPVIQPYRLWGLKKATTATSSGSLLLLGCGN